MSNEKEITHADLQIPRRFTVPQRIEHFLLAASFTILGLTGLVQKYALNSISEWLIALLGGIQMTRIIHRAAAIVFVLLSIYHVIIIAYKYFVCRLNMTMLPTLKDVTDGIHSLRFSLFLHKNPPKLPRYNFAEKLEYWALIWGGIIMVVTGFMLWNPLITTAFLPGQFIPAAKAAHGGEAVLAVLAIIIWHFYNVHIKMFNKSMFTGKLTRHQMEEEHGAEWDEFLSGKAHARPSPHVLRRRRILFMPIAILAAASGVGGIYWAATAEATAVSTLPVPLTRTQVYSPQAASEASVKAAAVSAPSIPHPIAGQEKCFQCHGRSGMKPMPANHESRPIESCRICHKLGPAPKRSEPVAEKAKAAGPKPVPHPTEESLYKDCRNCHDLGKLKPYPANHSNYPLTTCKACHK
ncbi:MAG: cytochrome b/b6 domain-containing protein [Acidobacteria bacterium]|nr:cytochrome b/b6 domain-containing protein [Acidobacteriota bacterium]